MRALLRLTIGFALLFSAALGGVLVFRQARSADEWVVHTLQVQEILTGVLSRLQDTETGQRGFVLTRKSEFLQPYYEGRRSLASELSRLQTAVSDNPAQHTAAGALGRCAETRVHFVERGIAQVNAGQRDAAVELIWQGAGKKVMDRCRAIVASMKKTEQILLGQRLARVRLYTNLLYGWFFAIALIVVAITLYLVRAARGRADIAEADRKQLAQLNAELQIESGRREAAQAELQKLMKMESIGQLAAGIAHDFNNMLAIIMGSLEMLRRRIPEEDFRGRVQLDAAFSSAQRAAQLTGQLLAFGRRQTLAPKIIDCGALARRSASLLRAIVGKSISLEITSSPLLWPVAVDPGELESALVNLCINAREAMSEGGRLLIAAGNAPHAAGKNAGSGDMVRLAVRDWGTGMPESVRERAFEPFFTTKGVGRGSGMGLSQVYGFIRQSGGYVELHSTPGRGTEVSMFFPRYVGHSALAVDGGDAVSSPSAKRAQGEVIAVIDDEQHIRDTVAEALREFGYLVVNCATPQSALELITNGAKVDLLLTDAVMPGLSGVELARRARVLRPEMNIMLMSGYSRDALAEAEADARDFDLLSKPFTIAGLAARVRASLDGR